MMTALFKCEMNYIESKHLSQLYAGFEILKRKGIAEIHLHAGSNDNFKPILKVRVNDSFTIVYDTLDGLNWIDGSVQDNLNYFRNNTEADYYFKRSFNKQITEFAPGNCKVFPLGLNYNITPENLHKRSIRNSIKNGLRNKRAIAKFLKINDSDIFSEKFEYYPVPNKINKILFLTRLWDPEEVKQEHLKSEREAINQYRIDCIRLCKKEFKNHFTGGLQQDRFSLSVFKDLLVPYSLTKREAYLHTVKESNICISTTGLHNSIGFKLGEYVAASRAIVSEPLYYELPGDFEMEKNYYCFRNADELIAGISRLMNHTNQLQEMMHNNHQYYNNYLRPDMLVLNSLLIAAQDKWE